VLVAVILLSNKYKVNPDNMATPLAASIGDVVSISMLSFITSVLFANLGEFRDDLTEGLRIHELPLTDTHLWTTYVVIGVYFLLLPFWILLVLRNRYTRPVLKSGWIPVLSALFISG
jgi:solute carrier family 41